jgi:hypothetical protein
MAVRFLLWWSSSDHCRLNRHAVFGRIPLFERQSYRHFCFNLLGLLLLSALYFQLFGLLLKESLGGAIPWSTIGVQPCLLCLRESSSFVRLWFTVIGSWSGDVFLVVVVVDVVVVVVVVVDASSSSSSSLSSSSSSSSSYFLLSCNQRAVSVQTLFSRFSPTPSLLCRSLSALRSAIDMQCSVYNILFSVYVSMLRIGVCD